MSQDVLPYASKDPANRDVRLAGIVLIVWASLDLPLGIVIAGYGAMIVDMTFWPERQVSVSVLWLWALSFLLLGIAVTCWGIDALKTGIALLKGRYRTLRSQILMPTICEWLAYGGVVPYVLFLRAGSRLEESNESDLRHRRLASLSLAAVGVHINPPDAQTRTPRFAKTTDAIRNA